eukprot:6204815-Pleurochrysis_carterae.AAC.1
MLVHGLELTRFGFESLQLRLTNLEPHGSSACRLLRSVLVSPMTKLNPDSSLGSHLTSSSHNCVPKPARRPPSLWPKKFLPPHLLWLQHHTYRHGPSQPRTRRCSASLKYTQSHAKKPLHTTTPSCNELCVPTPPSHSQPHGATPCPRRATQLANPSS